MFDKQFKIVDMTIGKAIDDGCRGVHIYYQHTTKSYPIEIQFNTFYDRQINDWLHKFIYKKNIDVSIGSVMRKKYEQGMILNENQFKEELDNVLFSS